MSKKKKKTTLQRIIGSRFYQVYIGVVVLILIAMCIGRVWLNGVLVDYEAAQPVYVAEKVANLFEGADYETLYKLDTSAAEIAGGDEAFYLDSMREITDGKTVAWSEAFSPNEDEHRYTVTLDGDRFATFSLVPSDQTTRHGNTLWKLGSVSTLVRVEPTPEVKEPEATPVPTAPAGVECRVRVPDGCVVTVDGVQLTEYNAAVTSKSVMPDGFLPAGVTGVTNTEYVFNVSGDAPVIEVKDSTGTVQEITQTSRNVWSCTVPGNEAFQQQYSNAVLSLAKRIALVTARDASVESMLKYCASNSPARTIFQNYSNRWATPHSKTDFQNVQITDFYVHSDTCFTCHVSFDFRMATSQGVQTYPTAYTFCIIRQGGTGKLYNLMMQ